MAGVDGGLWRRTEGKATNADGFGSLQPGLTDHRRDLTGGVELPAFDGQSPRLYQLTAGFTDTLCTKAKR